MHCSSAHDDLIAECCRGIPWHGRYFNSVPGPAEKWGLRPVPIECTRICPHIFLVCEPVCVCARVWTLAFMCCGPHVSSDRNLIAVNSPKSNAVPNRENPPSRSSLSPLIYTPFSHRWAQTSRWWMAIVLQGAFSFIFFLALSCLIFFPSFPVLKQRKAFGWTSQAQYMSLLKLFGPFINTQHNEIIKDSGSCIFM